MKLYLHTNTKIKKILNIIVFFFIIIIILLLFIKIIDILKFKCIIKELFKIYCPGCGTTRMLKSIFKLEFYQAFRFNPLFFILFIMLIILLIINIYTYIKKDFIYVLNNKQIIILIIIMFIYMILRNIDYFSYLIPTIL